MIPDVNIAFLIGHARSHICVPLPRDITDKYPTPVAGRLKRALYGTRDAPMIWSDHLRYAMANIGCEPSELMPGVFFNRSNNLLCVAHVDDILCVSEEMNLVWLKSGLDNNYVLKAKTTGPEEGDEKVAEFLGRRLTWIRHGVAWEGNETYARNLLREHDVVSCNPVRTPFTPGVYANRTSIVGIPAAFVPHSTQARQLDIGARATPSIISVMIGVTWRLWHAS